MRHILARCLPLLLLAATFAGAQNQPPRKRILVIGEAKGFQHDSISDAMGTIWKLGKDTGLWDCFLRTDSQLITKKKLPANAKNLDYFDAIFFLTTGELPLDDEQKAALLSFVRDEGKAFIGAHTATDTFYKWPEYGEMIGAYFVSHPWTYKDTVPILVEDRTFPATRHFPLRFEITDEIYQFKEPYDRSKLRVLMRLDEKTLDMSKPGIVRTDNDFAVTWVKTYGKGRVFYSSLGHNSEVWADPRIQKMWVEGIRWALGFTTGDTTPRPKQ